MYENSLTHYGVMGMKWGRRKSKASKGSNVKTSNKSKSTSKNGSGIKKKIQNITSKVDKEKVKKIAKTTAIVAGSVAAAATLGTLGSVAYSNIMNNYNKSSADLHNYMMGTGKYANGSSESRGIPAVKIENSGPNIKNIGTNSNGRKLITSGTVPIGGAVNDPIGKAFPEEYKNTYLTNLSRYYTHRRY